MNFSTSTVAFSIMEPTAWLNLIEKVPFFPGTTVAFIWEAVPANSPPPSCTTRSPLIWDCMRAGFVAETVGKAASRENAAQRWSGETSPGKEERRVIAPAD